jgi:hypothetical protein
MPDTSASSQASALLTALSSADRLTLVSCIARRQADGGDHRLTTVAADLRVPVKALVKEVTRLQECGLVTVGADRALDVDLSVLAAAADALVAGLPITGLLRTAPELRRHFVHGRLVSHTVDHDVKLRLSPLLARLLPDDRAMTESEVNAILGQVHDDHAYLRRMLVDFGQLTRDGASNYRRAG